MRSASNLVCSNFLRAYSPQALRSQKSNAPRSFSCRSPLPAEQAIAPKNEDEDVTQNGGREEGAMSRRLSEMAEETMNTWSKSDRRLMEDAGFSEELKRELEERIVRTSFQAEHQQAFSEVNMASSAGRGTRDLAAAQPWTGNESLHDSALRMLDDSHKRVRVPAPPRHVSLKPPPKKKTSTGQRLANARDKTSIYALSQQVDLTEEERGKMRKEMKERFSPAARPMPTTLQGLTSLANERIEDAIARGQFRNIPRGKGTNVERDYNANSPFLDTTEYFMNKIIQKQEIVPPWIEKQQELVKLVSSFRSRLRNDWKRHAARSISSKGGNLDEQITRAQAFALAEEKQNPQHTKVERLSEIDSDGTLSTVTVIEKPVVSCVDGGTNSQKTIKAIETSPEGSPSAEDAKPLVCEEISTHASVSSAQLNTQPPVLPMAYPFRDPQWEKTENAYHTLAINELNTLTRGYNLMAPKIAQKPYHTLSRELARCFADVAPILADEIAQRARAPIVKMEIIGHREGGVMEKFGTGHIARVRDEDVKKGYGFKEFWRDLFRREEGAKA